MFLTMTVQEKREDMKRPKFEKILLEVLGSLDGLPEFEELVSMPQYIDTLNDGQVFVVYNALCEAVYIAAHMDIEDQYGLDKEDAPKEYGGSDRIRKREDKAK
jgi:hypothetical protein